MCSSGSQSAAPATPAPPPQSPDQNAAPRLTLIPQARQPSKARSTLLTINNARGAGLTGPGGSSGLQIPNK